MIGNLISKLEDRQNQFRDFGALMAKILLKGRDETESILKLLNKYTSHNLDVEIIDVNKIEVATKILPDLKRELKELNYLVRISFNCAWCKNKGEEETNLSCFWSPARTEGKPICSGCMEDAKDRSDDMAYEAYREKEELEKEREKRLKNFPIIEEEYEHE